MDGSAAAARHPGGGRALTAPVEAPARLGHVPALDGIRGVAVAAVLLYHGGVAWAPAGFLGVDIFFVLSGFLITTLLIGEMGAHGGISLRAFWTRRARRLIPAMAATAIAVVAAAPYIAEGRSPASVRLDAAAALAYVANWRFILNDASYFDRTGGPSPLEHTWSLGVEEQFYLVWPLLALIVLRRDVWRLGIMAAAGIVASIGAMALVYRPGEDSSRAYFGTDTRVHVVLIGALAAVLVDRWRASGRTVDGPTRVALALGAVVGVALVGAAIGTSHGDDSWLYRGGFALVSVGVAFLIAEVVMVQRGLAARVLSIEPLGFLGRISYGAYLWHWPLFLYLTRARTGWEGNTLLGARLAATVVVATVSAVLLENPIRRGRVLPGLRAGIVLPIVAATLAGVIALDAIRVEGRDDNEVVVARVVPPPLPIAAGEPLRLLVVGDSVAKTVGVWIRRSAAASGVAVSEHAVLGCGIARGGPYRYFGSIDEHPAECEAWPERWASVVEEQQPHVALLIVGRWEVMDRMRAGEWRHIGMPAYDAYLERELELAIEVLSSRGARVALATAPYYRRGERPDGGIWPEDEEPRVDRFNELVREVAARHPGIVAVVDLNAKTTDRPGRYTHSVDGVRLRTDGVHFGQASGRFLGPWLIPQIQALVAPRPVTTTAAP